MKTIYKFALFLILSFSYSYTANAQSRGYTLVQGNSCEDTKEGESATSTYAKAADKASFEAVKNIELIQLNKNKLNLHDYDVLIYQIIDSALVEVETKTISEDQNKICLSTTGKIDNALLHEILDTFLQKREESVQTDVVIEAVQEQKETDINFTKPEIKPEDKGLVYISPTEFYNGAISDNHSKLIRHYLSENDNFYITNDEEIADFIVHPSVTKARIDENKNGVKQLQLQTVMLVNSADGEQIMRDEQSRSIICDENKTEQQNAQALLKKMLDKSSKRISIEIEKFIRAKANSIQ